MTHDWITTLLALGFFAATAAFFVVWSKYEEQKVKTREEHDRRWDEISRATSLENELDQMKLTATKYKVWFEECRNGNHALQDRLSALLCPRQNHVWKDGVCVKCGRVKDALP